MYRFMAILAGRRQTPSNFPLKRLLILHVRTWYGIQVNLCNDLPSEPISRKTIEKGQSQSTWGLRTTDSPRYLFIYEDSVPRLSYLRVEMGESLPPIPRVPEGLTGTEPRESQRVREAETTEYPEEWYSRQTFDTSRVHHPPSLRISWPQL